MEIEEDVINNLITCKICKQVLEEPVSLPCQKTICSKHLLNETDVNSIYECFFCNKSHQIDRKELTVHEEIQKLIDKKNKFVNKDFIDFGVNNRLARDSCEILQSILDEAKLLSNDPAYFVHEFFSDLKNEIDQKKEEYVEKIEEKYETIMNQVLELEKECKAKTKKEANDLEKIIQEVDDTLKKWNESLNQLNFSKDDEWKSMRFDAAKQVEKLEDEMEKLKNDLLLNKDYEFIPIDIKDETLFGNFQVSNFEIGKINMILNNFSSIKSVICTSNGSFVSSSESYINNIPWKIKTRLIKKNDKELISFFVKYYSTQGLISTKLSLKIKQNEIRKTGKDFEGTFYKKFEGTFYTHGNFEGTFYTHGNLVGKRSFCSKEDILDPLNGVYNKKNDSIILEATIRILS